MGNIKRSSYIEKHVELVVNLGNYESMRVGTTFGETIEWETAEERQKKLDAITENLKREVAKDVNDCLKSFDLEKRSNLKIDNKSKVAFEESVESEDLPEISKQPKAAKKNVDDIQISSSKEDKEFSL